MTRRPGRLRFGLRLAVCALGIAGCGLLPGGAAGLEIDGIPIGASRTCADLEIGPARCNQMLATARERLDRLVPGHADVVRVDLYARAESTVDAAPALAIDTRFSLGVVVLSLADGTRRAVEIICNPGRGDDRAGLPAGLSARPWLCRRAVAGLHRRSGSGLDA